MSSQIKLAVLDMDGTVLSNDHRISKENNEAVKLAVENGITVVIATGRSLMAVEDYAEELNLNDYIITGNGSEIWHLNGPELIERTVLDTKLVELMWELRNTYKARHWAASVGKVWKQEMPDNMGELEWLKFGFDLDDEDVREDILSELKKHDGLEISNSHPLNIEVNAKGVHKAKAIHRILEFKKLNFDQVLACGDSLNDMTMIQQAGIGVAMGNAQPAVKEAADFVTLGNQEHGVAEAFRHFKLI
ncbi:Cof-type HAD-IIB family hydrolase [Alkalicoccus daliensis]|uniref:Phosphoglycolate phosphatase n=1 Tax=Alkalicoccus daliensis TaxID=745820 RepID=A0A1H0AHS0_9BACI|nr:Cof-type HAD-IIB family hydrolase [Alkalicoccus daliensis]SDN32937.1 hypothetical protein SAMN04488053_101487 [Alkalicoccus daliensis]